MSVKFLNYTLKEKEIFKIIISFCKAAIKALHYFENICLEGSQF